MAQPPLSQAVCRLEQKSGVTLFARTNRSVSLTSAGANFLESARDVLRVLDDGVEKTRCVSQGVEGHLTLTFIGIAGYPSVRRALRKFRTAFQAVSFTMQEATTQEQTEALEQGRADLGFMRVPGRSAPELRFDTLLREPAMLALPATYRLAHCETLHLSAFRNDHFVSSPHHLGQGFYDQLMQLCNAAGFKPHISQQALQLQTLVALVASGFGIALLRTSLAHEAREGIIFRPFRVDAPVELQHVGLLMGWNAHSTSLIGDKLIEEIRREMALGAD